MSRDTEIEREGGIDREKEGGRDRERQIERGRDRQRIIHFKLFLCIKILQVQKKIMYLIND